MTKLIWNNKPGQDHVFLAVMVTVAVTRSIPAVLEGAIGRPALQSVDEVSGQSREGNQSIWCN